MYRDENQQIAEKPRCDEMCAPLTGLPRKVYSDHNFLPCPSLHRRLKLFPFFKEVFIRPKPFAFPFPFISPLPTTMSL